jgi:hypothetical protein
MKKARALHLHPLARREEPTFVHCAAVTGKPQLNAM